VVAVVVAQVDRPQAALPPWAQPQAYRLRSQRSPWSKQVSSKRVSSPISHAPRLGTITLPIDLMTGECVLGLAENEAFLGQMAEPSSVDRVRQTCVDQLLRGLRELGCFC